MKQSAADVYIILTNIRNKLKSPRDEKFLGYNVHQLLTNADCVVNCKND